uniref:Amidophosphoribosyltransferase n=1 Tax=Saccoglossus kowalevskii TaxID=10224 RepID=A0ABM0M6L7_SACKO|nr:PREDICTED: amidophosphoribosyltransferase-like [Saccoglossus kowalevskii]
MAACHAYDDELEGLQTACGIFGVVATGDWPTQLDIAHVISLGLVGLQHRGQESAGITTSFGSNTKRLYKHKGMGLVSAIFSEEHLGKLKGNLGIGHTRYSTAGDSELANCQPFDVDTIHGRIAVAHNGELVNAGPLRKKVLKHGVGLSTGSDSELITQLLAFSPLEEELDGPNWTARIRYLMEQTRTAYSLVIMYEDCIYAVRDPYGNRPLCVGKLISGGYCDTKPMDSDIEGWVVSSESCSFQSIGAKYHREVSPGEIIRITKNGVKSLSIVDRPKNDLPAFCIFEYVYFLRPDSVAEGQMVYSVRRRCGRQLAKEASVEADLVSTVPESATPAAMGFAEEVHVRVASPPIKYPCYMGINIPTKEELIANRLAADQLAEYLGASSVVYLSVDGLVSAVRAGVSEKNENKIGHCTACLTGNYPVELEW